jgi:cation diffusion facilitator CzcD-associated flavoprotein CzcO
MSPNALDDRVVVDPARPPAPGMQARRLPRLDTTPRHVGAIVLGGGLCGIAAAIRLPLEAGIADTLVIEQAADFGGTWHHNTYPGAACDIPSALYSLEFAPNPGWTRVFAHQPEIREYFQTVARQYGLYERVLLNTNVREARWIESEQHWRIETTAGVFTTPIFVFAAGGLHEPATPDVPGIDTFNGTTFHTARWDHDYDLTGRRVAVIGSGASAVQLVPRIQPHVGRLTLLQRTPGWVWPKADWRTSRFERRIYRRFPAIHGALRRGQFEFADALVRIYLRVERARLLNLVGRGHLFLTIRDRKLRKALTPDYALGCKRVMLDNYYLRSLTKPNVEVIPHGLTEVREHSVIAADGSEHEVDTIIWATGFQASEPPFTKRIFGRDGRSLSEAWGTSPRAYMGASINGFPNAYMMWGPNIGTGGNTIMTEAQLNYICRAIALTHEQGAASLDIRREIVDAWKEEMRQGLANSTWDAGGCRSWYQGITGENYAVYGGTMRSMLARSKVVRAADYHPTPRSAADAPASRDISHAQ